MVSLRYYELAVLGVIEVLMLIGWVLSRFAKGRITRRLFYMSLLGFGLLSLVPIGFLLNSEVMSLIVWLVIPPYIGVFALMAEKEGSNSRDRS